MSTKPETTFCAAVNKRLPAAVYRMKNHNPYVGGIPDWWYSGPVGDLWVEAKWLPKAPVRAPARVDLSALQLAWLNARHAEGRNVAVMVGCPDGVYLMRDGHWNDEVPAVHFRENLITREEMAKFILQQTLGDTSRGK